MKVFVDTNVFLDLILKREGYREAIVIFNAIEKNVYQGVILDITLLNIDYVAKKQIKDIREFLLLVNTLFEVLGGSNESIDEALKLPNNDLEDNLQYITAVKHQCDMIISNDKDFYAPDMTRLTAKEFYAQI